MATGGVDDCLRILLIGKTGDGKSSTGNTILGRDAFVVSQLSKSETKTSLLESIDFPDGTHIEVVDTPGLFDTHTADFNHLPVIKELIRASLITTPGFHVIALVMNPGRFTPEVRKTIDHFFEWFGPGVENHACVIFTHIDSDEKMNRYINTDPHEKLKKLITQCQRRVACLDNEGSRRLKEKQVKKLFELFKRIKLANQGSCFTGNIHKLAQIYFEEKQTISNDSFILLRDAGLPLTWSRGLRDSFVKVLNKDFDTPNNQTKRGNLSIIDDQTGMPLLNIAPLAEQERSSIYDSSTDFAIDVGSSEEAESYDQVGGRTSSSVGIDDETYDGSMANTTPEVREFDADNTDASSQLVNDSNDSNGGERLDKRTIDYTSISVDTEVDRQRREIPSRRSRNIDYLSVRENVNVDERGREIPSRNPGSGDRPVSPRNPGSGNRPFSPRNPGSGDRPVLPRNSGSENNDRFRGNRERINRDEHWFEKFKNRVRRINQRARQLCCIM